VNFLLEMEIGASLILSSLDYTLITLIPMKNPTFTQQNHNQKMATPFGGLATPPGTWDGQPRLGMEKELLTFNGTLLKKKVQRFLRRHS